MVSPDLQDDLALSSYLAVLAASWRLVATITAAVLLLGLGYALLADPVYRADALVQVEDANPASGDALGQLSALFDGKSTVETETDLLRSRLVVGAAVDQLRLDIDAVPRRFPLIGGWLSRRAADGGSTPAWAGATKFAWGNERIDVADFDVPPAWRERGFVLAAREGNAYDLRSPDGDPVLHAVVGQTATGSVDGAPVRLRVTALQARAGTEFIVRRRSWQRTVGDLQIDLKIEEPSRQSGVMRLSLESHDSARVAETVNTLAQQYVQQNISRRSAEAEQTLGFMTRQLPVIRAELEQAEKRYNDYLTRHGTLNLPEEASLLLQQMVDAKTRLVGLQQQREELRQRFNDAHPSAAALDAQIAAAQRTLDQLTRQMSTRPAVEQGSMRLLRDVKVNTELYTSLLNNAQQLRVVKAGQVGNVRIVDHAIIADEPVRPRKTLVAALSLALGLLAGIGSAFLRKALFGGVESSEEIEQALGIPVFAIIPRSTEQRRLERAPQHQAAGEGVLAAMAPEDAAVEGLRSLRTALQFSMPDAPNKIVMVTGTAPGVGKSFTAINLSAVLATPASRVLLIDADMRRGEIHASFAAQRLPGLADVLQGVPLEKALLRDALPNLDVLCAGYRAPNPAELLMSERFAALLAQLSPLYDVIVIDTPPVLVVTDASLIGKHAGTTLLVVRHGSQPIAAIREAVKRLRYAGVALRGALLTDVPHWSSGYGTYQTESYDYGSARR